MRKTETPGGCRRTTRGYRSRSARQASPLQKKCGSKAAAVQKTKRPGWRRGALFYGDKSTRLVIAVSSKKCITCKVLKKRTLARLRKAGLALIKGGALVADKKNELKR